MSGVATAERRSRGAEAGRLRGCCLGLLLLAALLVAAVFVSTRALAAPDLGASPGGTAHGGTEAVIAASLAGDAAVQLVRGEHAVVVLSERDLTVIARTRNPSPARYRNPEARIRNGDIVVSADTSTGPFDVTAVATFALVFSDTPDATQFSATAVGYSAGQLPIPTVLGDRLVPNSSSTLNLTALFASNPILETLARSLDCLTVQSDGVHVGFHRPLTVPATVSCA